jgi:hypothetical protein
MVLKLGLKPHDEFTISNGRKSKRFFPEILKALSAGRRHEVSGKSGEKNGSGTNCEGLKSE